jgi:hypothetical protein
MVLLPRGVSVIGRVVVVGVVALPVRIRLRHHALHLGDGDGRQELQEQQEEREEQTERPDETARRPRWSGGSSPTRTGMKSRCSDIVMTKRSNHMPMFTKIDRMNEAVMFWRIFWNQKSCGVITLQLHMIQ